MKRGSNTGPKRKIAIIAVTALCAIGLVFNFSGCSKESPTGFSNSELENTDLSFSKASGFKLGNTENSYPQSTSRILTYINEGNCWQGGNIIVPGGTTFHLLKGAMIPPSGTKAGDSVTITMLVEQNNNSGTLEFTFGPSGFQFDPPAEVWFDWTDLHSSHATLYYIQEDGARIPQTPDYVDMQGKRMKISIDHFSRCTVGSE